MKMCLYHQEFLHRVELSYSRLTGDTYRDEHVFKDKSYDWEGDWEGRALLAFVCMYRLRGEISSSLNYEIGHLAEHTNKFGYFGSVTDGTHVSEQLLSGNGWFLRGLCEYYRDFHDEKILRRIESIVKNLYLRCSLLYEDYPSCDRGEIGGVSGNTLNDTNGWMLSSDVGCAFIALDGLSAAYKILRSESLKQFIDARINQFISLDKLALRMQTHATLTVCRAVLRMYFVTEQKSYLEKAQALFDLYLQHGMTLTYENFNWFERRDTWTEPCAVIDSLIVALHLWRATRNKNYLTLARRIYFNGFRLEQRNNGGAGPNSCVTNEQPYFYQVMYEAEFCCSMRTAECLWQVSLFAEDLFSEDDSGKPVLRDEYGRYFRGDHMQCKDENGVWQDLPSIYKYSADELQNLKIRVVFE